MNKNITTALIVSGGLAAIYFFIIKPKQFNKSKAIDTIISKEYYSSGRENLEGFEDAFILAWGNAAKKEEGTFIYDSKVFLTQGGKAKI